MEFRYIRFSVYAYRGCSNIFIIGLEQVFVDSDGPMQQTLGKWVKYVAKYVIEVVLVSLLLTLNIFHTFF